MNATTPPIGGVHESALYVDDLHAARRFWEGLGFIPVAEKEGRHVFLRVGNDMLLLFNADATLHPSGDAPPHGASGPGHVAFDVPDHDALHAWVAHLEAARVPIETRVDWPNGGASIYFRDPSGNSIELITRGAWGF